MMPDTLRRVLVADDEPLTRWAVSRVVHELGMRSAQAATREEACGLLFAEHFDAVVMACYLSDCDMTDVLSELDQYRPATGLVILCECDAASELREKLPRAAVFEKPFALDQIVAAVQARCGGSPTPPARPPEAVP